MIRKKRRSNKKGGLASLFARLKKGRHANRRRNVPSHAAAVRGGKKAARLMKRDTHGHFIGKRHANPKRKIHRRRRNVTISRKRYAAALGAAGLPGHPRFIRAAAGKKRTRKRVARTKTGAVVRKAGKRHAKKQSMYAKLFTGRTANRRLRRHRRHNAGRAVGGFMPTVKRLALPVFGGAAALIGARLLGNWLESKRTIWKPGVTGLLGSAGAVGLAYLAGKYGKKYVSPQLANALMIGAGIDVAMRLGGLVIPGTLGAFLRGESAAAPMLPAATADVGGLGGGWDVYESGLLGGYVSDPSEVGGAVGGYIPDNSGVAGYLPEPSAGSGYNVTNAQAGLGAMVREAPAGFGGGANFNYGQNTSLDAEIEDSALDATEAAVEGLSAQHAQVSNANGYMIYATPETAQRLQGRGHRVSIVKHSADVYPGTPIVAVTPPGLDRPVAPGSVPVLESANRGEGFNRRPMPVDDARPAAPGGIFNSMW